MGKAFGQAKAGQDARIDIGRQVIVGNGLSDLARHFGSEIGKRWGRHTVLITSLRPVPAGTEGAISAEGTAASLVGSLVMTLLMAALGLIEGGAAIALVSTIGLCALLLLARTWKGGLLVGQT